MNLPNCLQNGFNKGAGLDCEAGSDAGQMGTHQEKIKITNSEQSGREKKGKTTGGGENPF